MREILAVGAFGTVCVVDDPDGVSWATKIPNLELRENPEVLHRCRDEGRILALLEHPNIARLGRVWQSREVPAVQMEWIRGMNVEAALQALPPIPFGVSLHLIRQLFVALDYAWNAVDSTGAPLRCIHRDVKPANLLVGIDGRARVVDFGIARGDFEDRESVTTNMMLGARHFTAPERLDGGVDKPTGDAFSLGLVLYALLSRKRLAASLHPTHHQRAVEQGLDELVLQGTTAGFQGGVKDLLHGLLQYSEAKRPTHTEAAARLEGLAERAEDDGDVVKWCLSEVKPRFDARAIPSPESHPAWKHVAFLEEPTSRFVEHEVLRVDLKIRRKIATDRVREALKSPGAGDPATFRAIALANPDWDEALALPVLDAAGAPWWAFWDGRRSDAATVRLVLDLLAHRTEWSAAIRAKVNVLARHSDRSVAEGARAALSSQR